MLTVVSGLSGEVVANFEADEIEGTSVKVLKNRLAKQIQASRFQQRWLSGKKDLDDETKPDSSLFLKIELLIVDFIEPEDLHIQKLLGACAHHHLQEVEELLRLPLSPCVTDESGRTALHVTALLGDFPCASLLLEAAAAVDQEALHGQTALRLAAPKGHIDLVRLLLENAADPDKARVGEKTPLHLALATGHLEVLKLLLRFGAQKVDHNDPAATALHWAAKNRRAQVVEFLLDAGVDKDSLTRDALLRSFFKSTFLPY